MSRGDPVDVDELLARPLVARVASNGPTIRPIWFLCWHGRRVQELGLGRMAKRTSHVAPSIGRVLADPACRARSQATAARLAAEDGAGAAADVVENVLGVR